MRVERLLSVNMAILAVLGTTLLGMGQLDPILPLLTLAVAITSVKLTDRKKTFRLNSTVANLAALVAVGISLLDFTTIDRNLQLLAIANLLVYLQVVVFFQEKTPRIYWQLAMLSLLQVVVAAALNYSIIFGILLVLYMFQGLATLTMFLIYREAQRYAERTDSGNSNRDTSGLLRGRAADRPVAEPEMVLFSTASAEELGQATTRKALLRNTSAIGLATLALTVVVFVAVPRVGNIPWRNASLQPISMVGYDEEVTLGELGDVVENPETVMRVQFVDQETKTPFRLAHPPRFRGSVVTTYTTTKKDRNYRWSQTDVVSGDTLFHLNRPPGNAKNLVRQRITLEPMDDRVVFCVTPAYRLVSRKESQVYFDRARRRIVRRDELSDKQISIELGTAGIRDDRQVRFVPESRRLLPFQERIYRSLPEPNEDGSDPLAGLKRVAGQVVVDANVEEANPILKAQALEAFFLNTGGFFYSLGPQPERNEDLDPIEDFVVNHRSGHCEYFASALTLMLRSQGIPARMVIGFKCDEWNDLGRFYQVRQLHAHTWVEVYLSETELRNSGVQLEVQNQGAWYQLDPTASLSGEQLDQSGGILAGIGQAWDYVEMLWISYVVGLNSRQQQTNIFDPVSAAAQAVYEYLLGDRKLPSPADLRQGFAAAWDWLKGNWFSWRGALLAVAVSLALAGLSWFVRFARRRLSRRRAMRSDSDTKHRRMQIEFYRRLEHLLARKGLLRAPGQTQREFAQSVGGEMTESDSLRDAASLPRRIVETFYRVRFGGRTLDSRAVEAVEHDLGELQAAFSKPNGGRSN